MTKNKIGDGPIDPQYRMKMEAIARALDDVFNADRKGDDRQVGFILLVFPFEGREGRCNYISNAERNDVVTLLKEQIARFEGQPEMTGKA